VDNFPPHVRGPVPAFHHATRSLSRPARPGPRVTDTGRIGIDRVAAAVEPDDINAKGGKLVRHVPKLSEPAFWQAAPGPP
jgi:hypothetical protein